MKIVFHLAHPAHFHLFKNIINNLKKRHSILITYNEKDVLYDLISNHEFAHLAINLKSPRRFSNSFGLIIQFFEKEFHLYKILRDYKPDLIVGTSIIIAHVGKVLNVETIIVNEDDFDVIIGSARIGYPFCSHILAPSCCRTVKWSGKTITYDGYHELAYLSSKYFLPDHSVIDKLGLADKRFFVLRFAELGAHHDIGKSGITASIAKGLIDILRPYGKILITSEKKLESDFEAYRMHINPLDIHHILYFADLYIGDSQTMAAEAAVLGTPSLRYNDFVGKLSYLDELENVYGLTFGIKTNRTKKLYEKIEEVLSNENLKYECQKKRKRLEKEKIDVTAFISWFIDNYPESSFLMKQSPDYQYRFKFKHDLYSHET